MAFFNNLLRKTCDATQPGLRIGAWENFEIQTPPDREAFSEKNRELFSGAGRLAYDFLREPKVEFRNSA